MMESLQIYVLGCLGWSCILWLAIWIKMGETRPTVVRLQPPCYVEVHLLGIVFHAKGHLWQYLELGLK